jgi:hypothetical protein
MTKATRRAPAKKKLTDDQKRGEIEFEPWTKEVLEEAKPVSNEKWNEIGRHHLPTVRIAWITLGKTKEELKEIALKLSEETDILDQITDGIVFFKRYAELMELAQLRLLIAGSAALAEAPT